MNGGMSRRNREGSQQHHPFGRDRQVKSTVGFRRIAPVVSAVLLSAVLLTAGARAEDMNGFVQQAGHGDVALSYTTEHYDHFWFGPTRLKVPGPPSSADVNTDSLSVWVAYGITDDLTLVANLPWIRSDGTTSFGLKEEDFQDFSVYGKYRFLSLGSGDIRNDFVAAAGVRTNVTDYENNVSPVNIGDGTTDGLFSVIYQFNWRGLYASQQVSYAVRGADAPNNLAWYTEAGYTCHRVTFTGWYSVQDSRGGTDIGDPGFTFPSNRKDYQRIGAKLYGRVSDTLGFFGGYFWTLDGRNVGDASGWSAGLNISF